MKRPRRALLSIVLAALAIFRATTAVAASSTHGRIFILMVWDGLRPDLVSPTNTPALATLAREGVDFPHHHSAFPTVTMVDGAVLATGASPGTAGIFGDWMYFAPLRQSGGAEIPGIGDLINAPINLEHTPILTALDAPQALN